jgi:hypothetical protein
MRSLVLVLLGAVLAAGCVSQSGVVDPTATPASSSATDTALAADPTFCQSASNCDFWDDDYHEYVLYDVDTYVIDVLIVPSVSYDTAADTPAIRKAVQAWEDGIDQLAATWFKSGFEMNVYLLGTDAPPQSALEDPEIIVVAAEYNPVLLLGIGQDVPFNPCRGGAATQAYAPHEHDGMTISAADCQEGGFTCVALNTNFLLGSKNTLYDLIAHEFGHCLGLGHVGDALDFSAKRVPIHDIMSYQETPGQVHCVSTLNVRTLESLYAPLFGQTVSQPVSAGDYYTMPMSQYSQVNCPNP